MIRLLLDTHAFLWFVDDDPRLSAPARVAIEDPTAEVLVSPASYWEIAIKVSRGNYTLNRPFLDYIEEHIRVNRFTVLPVEPRHAAALIGLPFHHKDPFDRLLVAQAMVEGVPLVTCDAALVPYPVTRLW